MKVRRGVADTIRLAFGLIEEWYTRQPSKTNNIGVLDFLLIEKKVNPGLKRMYFFVQRYLRDNDIDLLPENREEHINAFIAKWNANKRKVNFDI